MMRFVMVLGTLLMFSSVSYGSDIQPPCEQQFNFPPRDPIATLQPVPSTGSFVCAGLVFSNFSSNILDGGMIGASYFQDRYGFLCFQSPSCGAAGEWPSNTVLFEVQPTSPELGFSYMVSGDANDPLRLIDLPPLNHVTSGSPTVTVNFGGINLMPSSGLEAMQKGFTRAPNTTGSFACCRRER